MAVVPRSRINMHASPLSNFRLALACLLALLAVFGAPAANAQDIHIPGELVAEEPAAAGNTITVAIAFNPEEGWHGYWSNPGDAGFGMQVEWDLPEGWTVGGAEYPVPQRYIIAGLMNHVFEGPYAVLYQLRVPEGQVAGSVPVSLVANYLACTDKICVPQIDVPMRTVIEIGGQGAPDPRFAQWRANIPPMLDMIATDQIAGDVLRLSIPLPAALDIGAPHIFIENKNLIDYNAVQSFSREGDVLTAEIPLGPYMEPPGKISGIIALDDGMGLRFVSETGRVAGTGLVRAELAPLWLLLFGALAGGLILNIMPCVFPILSLKALSLARAGESEKRARAEGLAYTAGVVLACLALGGLLLALRAAGEQVGWAFQLQQPGVVAALLALALAITANFAGVFELPSMSFTRSGEPAGAFATGLLAAFVATPCTGPFMAAALGAALLLPAHYALLLFAALGLGLALPFLALGFIPALRRMLPKPGPWMETFRRTMAIPMGLTALALLWLCWRIGGIGFSMLAGLIAVFVVLSFVISQKGNWPVWKLGAFLAFLTVPFLVVVPPLIAEREVQASQSMLEPIEFGEAALAEARQTGQPIFLWFTADWCVSCKVNEGIAIEREATRAAFEQAGVIAMRGDWTRPDPEISAFLTKQAAAGVPLYLWYDANGSAQTLPQVLTPDSLVTLANSAGEPPAIRPGDRQLDRQLDPELDLQADQ